MPRADLAGRLPIVYCGKPVEEWYSLYCQASAKVNDLLAAESAGWIRYSEKLPAVGERVLHCFRDLDHEYHSNEVEIGTWSGEFTKGRSLVMEQQGHGWYPANYWMPLPEFPVPSEDSK